MDCLVGLPPERVACSHESDAGRTCATRLLWMRVQGGVMNALHGTTLGELVEFSERHTPSERHTTPERHTTEPAVA
jgi:DNA-binding IscR family transcriptional regulator